MRPLIGIPTRAVPEETCTRFDMQDTYTRAVDRAGGVPVLIPLGLGEENLRALYERLDGLLFAGGVDVHPKEFGEEVHPQCGTIDEQRDETELRLARWALAEGKPVFGICRGVQLLNIASGGTLYQDLPAQRPQSLTHTHSKGQPHNKPSHPITLAPDSTVARILNATSVGVNSSHHQAVAEIGAGLRPVAQAPDGVVEALEGTNGNFVVGVQFHPERMIDEDTRMLDLFKALVHAASARNPVS